MPDNVLKVREIKFTKLQASGAPLVTPTAADVLLLDYGQSVNFSFLTEDGKEMANEGPLGTICKVKTPDKLIGCQADMQVAKRSNKLTYFIQGGSYVEATDVHTPPFSTSDAPDPVAVEFYGEMYDDGEHFHGEQTGYVKWSLPKAKGKLSGESFTNDSFDNPSLTLTGKEYIDTATPGNSKPCYLITEVATLPSDGSYTQPFLCVDNLDAPVTGVLVSVTVDGTPVTGTTAADGTCELTLPYGVHTYTASKESMVSVTASVTVGLINAAEEVEMLAS